MKRISLTAGLALLPIAWLLAGSDIGMIGHMAGRMMSVALAAPLVAYGLSGSSVDPAARWPHIVTPMMMMLVELVTVWLWHLPALRIAAQSSIIVMVIEQACFLAAGLLLWSAVIHTPQRAAGIGALLLTSMHMTLLGVLIGLAPRPLYHAAHHGTLAGMDTLADQQLGGVIMLMIGAASYFLGGLALLSTILRSKEQPSA